MRFTIGAIVDVAAVRLPVFVGQSILAAAGFQPASSPLGEFLGLRGATL
jgi:hypothetical protein